MLQSLYFVLAGVVFGMANIIPGVSGGTMAVVFGVYERLIGILSDPLRNIKKEWKFLVTFGVGLVVGILAFGKLMHLLLESKYRSETFLFFIGVILGSIPMLFKNAFMPAKKGKITLPTALAFLAGLAVMVPMVLSGSTDEAKEAAKAAASIGGVNVGQILLMLLYGVVASSTMIIPGISGSFVMLLLGVYGPLIAAVSALTGPQAMSAVLVLLPFGVGVVLGLVFCSKLIKFLLKKYPAVTYAAIFGFVLGSIGCVVREVGGITVIGVLALLAGVALLWAFEHFSPEAAKE
ncbi:MAG: DUF368 domain-containing protein [Clostridia bacterium]|nr:DUF368 domain-containing protein [Clostridia bacterium]